jgi:radical SAM protein with 4Fe4S-binding SPASM domain
VPASFRRLILEGLGKEAGLRGKVRRLARRAALGIRLLRRKGLRETLNVALWGFGPKRGASMACCLLPWEDTYFASDGKVYPCCIQSEVLGDLNHQSWETIWNGAAYRNLRRTIHSWNPTDVCRHCPLPSGINGGDERRYEKFFADYSGEELSLETPELEFVEGFQSLERRDNGAPSHIWMERRGRLRLPRRKKARFVRLSIIPRTPPLFGLNAGTARLNGGPPEPFDNTCAEITFPLDHIRDDSLEISLEMEARLPVENDPRELALAVSGVQLLNL